MAVQQAAAAAAATAAPLNASSTQASPVQAFPVPLLLFIVIILLSALVGGFLPSLSGRGRSVPLPPLDPNAPENVKELYRYIELLEGKFDKTTAELERRVAEIAAQRKASEFAIMNRFASIEGGLDVSLVYCLLVAIFCCSFFKEEVFLFSPTC